MGKIGGVDSATTAGGSVTFHVLGPVSVTEEGRQLNLGGPKQRTVLAMLVSRSGEVVSTDQLIEAVYGDDVAAGARRTIQTYVSNLRGLIGGGVIQRSASGWVLQTPRETIDATRFEDLYESALVEREGSPVRTAEILREALVLWRGHPYADVESRGMLEAEISRLSELRVAALGVRIEAELAAGRHAELIGELDGLVVEHPYQEAFRAQHMTALYRAGRQQEALRSFADMRQLLAEELGIDPTPALQDLEQRILEHDDSLLTGATTSIRERAVLVADSGDPLQLAQLSPGERSRRVEANQQAVSMAAKAAGDSQLLQAGATFYLLFDRPHEAARAARSIAGRLGVDGPRLAIDFGSVEVAGEGVSGPPLKRGASLVACAHPGQVLISSNAHGELAKDGMAGLQIEGLGSHSLPGIESPMAVYELMVGDRDFPPLATGLLPPPVPGGTDRSVPGYEIRERVGAGALGSLYRAYQPSVGREVFLEVIEASVASDPDFIRHFEAEAQRLTLIDHPNIVPVIDYWREPSGAFLVYPIHRGGTLDPTICDNPRRALTQISSALEYAHSSHLVHGALRPDRVFLDESGNCYVFGFPIVDTGRVPAESAAYIAPEQLSGDPATVATDVYALGVLAQELLSGEPIESDLDFEPVVPGIRMATHQAPENRSSVAELLADLTRGAAPEERPRSDTRNPYKGLSTFYEADSPDFHGRTGPIDEMIEVLQAKRALTVVGPSGSGKSSVVRAGLIPALRGNAIAGSSSWVFTDMLPGTHPFRELERALARVAVDLPFDMRSRVLDQKPDALAYVGRALAEGTDMLLVIDQLEELFTITPPSTRDRFIELLEALATQPRVRLVMTLRADFLDGPLGYDTFGALVSRSLVALLAPTKEELAAMIVEPSRGVGVSVSGALVERLVAEVHQQPGALPLLEHTMTVLFETRASDDLTVDLYATLGGISGSVGKRAEEAYKGLEDRQRRDVRQAFMRMVSVSETTRPTRRRVALTDLTDLSAAEAIDAFASRRLVVYDHLPGSRAPTVEVAHEALLENWQRLSDWIEEAQEDLVLRSRLDEAIAEWQSNGRHTDFLMSGGRLAQHLEWTGSTDLVLTSTEQEYLRESGKAETVRRERRRRTRRLVLAGFGMAAVISVILAVVAVLQRGAAEREAENARAAELQAEEEAERAAAEATRARGNELSAYAINALDTDPALAKLLAVASVDLTPPNIDTLSVLHRVWAADRVTGSYPWPQEHGVWSLWTDLHPGGSLLVSAGYTWRPSSHLEVADLSTGEVLWSFDTGDEAVVIDRPRFTPDGEQIVAGLNWSPGGEDRGRQPGNNQVGVFAWDAQSGELVTRLDVGSCGAMLPDLSSSHLLVGTIPDSEPSCFEGVPFERDLTLELVEPETGERQVLTTRSSWQEAYFSGDGRYVAFRDDSGQAPATAVVDIATGERLLEFDPTEHPGPSDGVPLALNHDGSLLLAGDRPVAVWDLETGEVTAVFDAQDGPTWWAEFSGTDDTVFTAGESGVHHWDARTGQGINAYPAVGTGRVSVVGERMLVTDVSTRTANLVEVGVRGEITAYPTCGGFVLSTSVWTMSPHVALRENCPDDDSREGARAFVFDIDEGELALTLPRTSGQGWDISPDGTRVVLQEQGELQSRNSVGPIVIRDLETSEIQLALEGLCTWDGDSPTDPDQQEGCHTYPRRPFPLWNLSLKWSPDSRLIAGIGDVGGQPDPTVIVWDATTGAIVHEYTDCWRGWSSPYHFSPDSSELIAICDGWLRVWSTDTWKQTRSAFLDESSAFESVGLIGVTSDGSRIVGFGKQFEGGWSIFRLNPETLEIETLVKRAFEGDPKSWALSPDGTLAAVGTSDGFVNVWDVQRGRVLHEIYIGVTQVQGVGFVDNQHLAVAPQEGSIYIYTIDPDELIDLVRNSLTRGFTQAECDRFGFDEDCPSLQAMTVGG